MQKVFRYKRFASILVILPSDCNSSESKPSFVLVLTEYSQMFFKSKQGNIATAF